MTVSDFRPAKHDFRIRSGDDLADTITIEEGVPLAAVDVSARTYAMQLRRRDGAGDPIDMVISMAAAATGIVGFSLDGTVTAGMEGLYLYDFEQTAGAAVRTLMAGCVIVDPDQTRT